jgi:hypothetical protein
MSTRSPAIFNEALRATRIIGGHTGMGPMGYQGFQGLAGSFGGPQGYKGEMGTQGVQGERGSVGFQGEKGDKGDQGEKGERGDAGYVGQMGLQGGIGMQGIQGYQGNEGVQGKGGEVGATGRVGTQGQQGDMGRMGYQGVEGTRGFQGLQGFMGAQGQFGGIGLQGSQGTQGLIGNDGVQGRVGLQGTIGLRGLPSSNKYTAGYTVVSVQDTVEETSLYAFNILTPVKDEFYRYTVCGFLDCDVDATLTWRFYVGNSILESIPLQITGHSLPRDFRITYERMVVDSQTSIVPIFVGIGDPLGTFASSSQSSGFAISSYAGGATTNERPTEQLTVEWSVARSGCRVVMSGYFVERISA